MKPMLILLAFMFALFLLTPAYAVDANAVYSVGNYTTIATGGRNSSPPLVYVNGRLIASTTTIDNGNWYGAESLDNGASWHEHWTMIRTDGSRLVPRSFACPITMFVSPTNPSRIYGVVMQWTTGLIDCVNLLIWSDDNGRHWAGFLTLPTMTLNGATYNNAYTNCVLSDGSIIVGVAVGYSTTDGNAFKSAVLICGSGKNPSILGNWELIMLPSAIYSQDEPAVAECPDGRVICFMRDNVGGNNQYVSWSSDKGHTWTQPTASVMSPASSATVLRVGNRLMLAWDYSTGIGIYVRKPLVVALSEDNGVSFGERLIIVSDIPACYPSLCLVGGGKIVVGYWYMIVYGSQEDARSAVLTPKGSPQSFDVTIQAYCDSEAKSLTMLQVTGEGGAHWNTEPFTYTVTTSSYTFSVPSTDPNGDSFRCWSTGSTGTTLMVTSQDTYTAYYGIQQENNMLIIEIAFGIGASILIIALVVTRAGLIHTRGKRRRHR
jgi:hypothetical protein